MKWHATDPEKKRRDEDNVYRQLSEQASLSEAMGERSTPVIDTQPQDLRHVPELIPLNANRLTLQQ